MNGGAFDDHYNPGFFIFSVIDCIAFITSFVHFGSSMFSIVISRCSCNIIFGGQFTLVDLLVSMGNILLIVGK